MNKMFERFSKWYKEKGQYECAPVGNTEAQVKAQIMIAYNAGYIHGSHDTEQVWIKESQKETRDAYAQGRAEGEESGRMDGWI